MGKSTVKVYRVEHRTRKHGPYLTKSGNMFYGVEGLHPAHEASKAHPGPRQDRVIGRMATMDHTYGFGSRERLDKWFQGFKRKLHAADFVIRVYEADAATTAISKKQAVFIKKTAKLVETLPMIRPVTKSA